MAHAQNNQSQRSITDTLTLLWAANESFAGAFLHALNIPFKGIYLTGFSLFMLQMIAESAVGRGKLISAGIKVSAIKAVINPFTSVNSHLAVLFQSAAGSLLLTGTKISLIRILSLSITAMMFTALQRLFLLWLFYGMMLYEAVNIFCTKIIGEYNFFNSTSNDYSFLIITVYLFFHLAAGVAGGIFIHKFSVKEFSTEETENISERFNNTISELKINYNSERKHYKWVLPIVILIFIAAITYMITPENFPLLLIQIVLRYVLAFCILMLIRTIYVSFVKKHSSTDPAISDTINDVRKMKIYYSFAYNETKLLPMFRKPEVFFRTLLLIANLQSTE